MTLPIPPLCDDKASLPLRTGVGKRRPACLSAAWADPPISRKERRRAICSWSVGYGTLTESEDISTIPDYSSINKGNSTRFYLQKPIKKTKKTAKTNVYKSF